MQARFKSIRLCEQCITAAKRTEDLDLVEPPPLPPPRPQPPVEASEGLVVWELQLL